MSDFNLFRYVLSFSATLAKRWKVQFRLGFTKFDNVDSINDRRKLPYIYIYDQYCSAYFIRFNVMYVIVLTGKLAIAHKKFKQCHRQLSKALHKNHMKRFMKTIV